MGNTSIDCVKIRQDGVEILAIDPTETKLSINLMRMR